MESDQQLENILSAQGQVKVELVGRLQKDEELQCAAVGALLERSDTRSWSLVHQVSLVESQLAALTAVEMERRKLQMSEQVVCIIYQNNMYFKIIVYAL
jgi:E3 ubiquitin-protein ligase LRSAM1